MFFGRLNRTSPRIKEDFLKRTGLAPSPVTAIKLWHGVTGGSGNRREVDALIETESGAIVVEDKLDDQFDVDQLVEEFEFSKKSWKNIRMLCISSHLVEPPEIEEARKKVGAEIHWIGWVDCLHFLTEVDNRTGLDDSSSREIAELENYMDTLGLGTQEGFPPDYNWKLHFTIRNASRELFALSKGILMRKGSTLTTQEEAGPEALGGNAHGKWFYRTISSGKGSPSDCGFLVAVGVFDGVPGIRVTAL